MVGCGSDGLLLVWSVVNQVLMDASVHIGVIVDGNSRSVCAGNQVCKVSIGWRV